jgi:hypothetical protein
LTPEHQSRGLILDKKLDPADLAVQLSAEMKNKQ